MRKFDSYYAFLEALEEETGFQVYDERTDEDDVVAPYIVCLNDGSDDVKADNIRYKKKDDIEVILHSFQTARHPITREREMACRKLEDFLDASGIPYYITPSFLKEYDLYADQYSVQVLYG